MSRLKTESVKRIGIFVFFNSKGKAGKYVNYLLESVSPFVDEWCIVSNCNLTFDTIQMFRKFSQNIFVRENSGLDAAAFKKALLYYCGIPKLIEYDEVLLFNDTFYGPFLPFNEIFNVMNERDIDFWGIMAGYKSIDGLNIMPEGYIPTHIQSWFRAFRRSIVQSKEFEEYWNNYDETLNSFWDVVSKHELVFTQYFERLGYKWDIYCESSAYCSEILEKNYNFYPYSAELMLRKMNMPFLKRKPFSLDRKEILYMNGGEDLKRAIVYLAQNSTYPMELIFQDLLSNYNIYDIYDSLHLNYLLEASGSTSALGRHKIGIFIESHSLDTLAYFRPYIERAASEIPVYVCVPREICENDSSWKSETDAMNAELVPCNKEGPFVLKDHPSARICEFVIYIHDAAYLREDKPDTIYNSILFNYCENILNSPHYISSLLETFESDPCLGVLFAPMPIHHKYFHFYENTWGTAFEKVNHLSRALRLKANLDRNKPIISASSVFCCRREVLDKLLAFPIGKDEYQSLGGSHTFSRLIQFLAQDAGFYAGIAMTREYASLELMNQRYYLSSIMQLLNGSINPDALFFSPYLDDLKRVISQPQNTPGYEEALLCSLYDKISERDREIERLYPLTSLKVQIKLRIKKYLPVPIYKFALSLKRLVFGPRQIIFDYTK